MKKIIVAVFLSFISLPVCADSTTLLGWSATNNAPQKSGDSGTGLFSSTATTLQFATGGVEAMRVTATGSVGIATTTPVYPLDVSGSARATAIISASYNNTATGAAALYQISGTNGLWQDTANQNIVVGPSNALNTFTQSASTANSGTRNTALGYQALNVTTTGQRNTGVGSSALQALTTGQDDTAVGQKAGLGVVTASDSTYIGYNSGSANSGAQNTAVGSNTMTATGTGVNNVALGYLAGGGITGGSGNSFAGFGAGQNVTTGSFNTVLGYGAGYNSGTGALTTGQGNILIGLNMVASTATVSNELDIGQAANYAVRATGLNTATPSVTVPGSLTVAGTLSGAAATWSGADTALSFVPTGSSAPTNGIYLPAANTIGFSAGGVEAMRVSATGNVGIGTTSPSYLLDVSGTAHATTFVGSGAGLTNLPAATNLAGGTANYLAYQTATGATGFEQYLAAAQEPAHTGDVTNTAGSLAMTVTGIKGILVGTPTGTAGSAVVLATSPTIASPTFTGAASGASASWSGADTASYFNATATGTTNQYQIGGVNAIYYPSNDSTGLGASIGIGYNSLVGQTASAAQYRNTSLGYNSMAGALTSAATFNVAVGYSSLNANQSGAANTVVGYKGFQGNISGVSNVGLGAQVMLSATNASANTLIGFSAGWSITSGSNNTFVGYQAGYNGGTGATTTGSQNILIGQNTIAFTATANNNINIGGIFFGNNNSTAAPAVSSCGSSPSIDTNANNHTGQVTVGSGVIATCTVTFAGTGYAAWNHCLVTPETASLAAFSYSYTKTVLTVTGTSLTSAKFDYTCEGE